MDEKTPPGGYRMVLALTELAPTDLERLSTEYLKSLPLLPWQWLEDARDNLWSGLSSRALRGEIKFRGVKEGAAEPSGIHPGLLRGSKPNFFNDTLVSAGITWHSVGVFRASDLVVSALASSPASKDAQTSQQSRRGPEHGPEFIQEIVRLALTPDGFVSRKELEVHMLAWFQNRLGDGAPSERSIQRWVKLYCPADMPDR